MGVAEAVDEDDGELKWYTSEEPESVAKALDEKYDDDGEHYDPFGAAPEGEDEEDKDPCDEEDEDDVDAVKEPTMEADVEDEDPFDEEDEDDADAVEEQTM